MRILLVQSYLGRGDPHGPVFPLGLACIASMLKKYQLKLLDLNVEANPYPKLKEELLNFDPHMVGLSVRNVDTTMRRDIFYYFKEVKPTAELIKKTRPGVKLVVGGSGFSMFAGKFMERVPEIDVGVYLEGEESMPELLANLNNPEKVRGLFIRKNSSIHFTGNREFPDFDALPMPDRNIVDVGPYSGRRSNNIGIETKRGCFLKCAYCSYPFLNGCRLRLRSPGKVVDEIEQLVKNFDIRNLMFVDSAFNISLDHARAICHGIINRGLDVKWNAYYDSRNIDEDFMLLAQKAGCTHFAFSPDAITDKGLDCLQKNFTEKDIYKTFTIARKMKGAKFGYSFFCNSPGQDLKGYLKTLFFFLKANLLLMGKGGVTLDWIRIEPNTRIHQIAVERAVMDENTDLLPVSEAGLRSLFYNPPPLKYMDPIVNLMLDIVDKLLKPLSRAIFSRER